MSQHQKDNDDQEGFIYSLHDKAREILSEYNDTLKGRCAVCLEPFCEDEENNKETFTERQDLVRIDVCFHRFHLICIYRDWYMQRKVETDEFGCEITYKVPKQKRCPICRRHVTGDEMEYIKEQFRKHPEVENHDYD